VIVSVIRAAMIVVREQKTKENLIFFVLADIFAYVWSVHTRVIMMRTGNANSSFRVFVDVV
jgi:hypothetical protein